MTVPSYPEMIVIGLVQGVSELFPVSSLGHSVLIPALIGGRWARDLNMTTPGSPYLDALVAMHVATAAALVVFYRRDWTRLVGGLVSSVRGRSIRTRRQRLAWLLVVGTVPVGLAGLALESLVRQRLGAPVPAALFLTVNGLLLFVVERLHRRSPDRARAADPPHPGEVPTERIPRYRARSVDPDAETAVIPAQPAGPGESTPGDDTRPAALGWTEALVIGSGQILALLPGISRSGATIAGGLLRGLSHADAARFAFLLATPVIAAAGVLKLPELARPEMRDAVGPTLAGSVVAGLGAYASLRFLTRHFETRTLVPFATYCLVAGLSALVWCTVTSV